MGVARLPVWFREMGMPPSSGGGRFLTRRALTSNTAELERACRTSVLANRGSAWFLGAVEDPLALFRWPAEDALYSFLDTQRNI